MSSRVHFLGPSRIRGIEGCWRRLGSLCHEDAAGFEVAWVGEAVGGAAQDLEQVVGALDSAVGGAAGVVPVEDLVGPCDERVDGVVVLGQLAGLVEVAEPSEGFQGAVMLRGRYWTDRETTGELIFKERRPKLADDYEMAVALFR